MDEGPESRMLHHQRAAVVLVELFAHFIENASTDQYSHQADCKIWSVRPDQVY